MREIVVCSLLIPPHQHVAFYQSLHGQIEARLGLWSKLRGEGIAAFNVHLKASGVPPVAAGAN